MTALTLVLVGAAVAFIGWVRLVYEPRQLLVEASNHRRYQVTMLRVLVDSSRGRQAKRDVLEKALAHCPTMPVWPEWREVWGDEDPLRE